MKPNNKSQVAPSPSKQKPVLSEKQKAPIHPELSNGTVDDRSCTDIICLLLLIFSLVAMIYIAHYGYSNGKPDRLIALFDPDGRACGLDLPSSPYLYFPILSP